MAVGVEEVTPSSLSSACTNICLEILISAPNQSSVVVFLISINGGGGDGHKRDFNGKLGSFLGRKWEFLSLESRGGP